MHPDFEAMNSKEDLIRAIIANAPASLDCPDDFESDLRDCIERIIQIERNND